MSVCLPIITSSSFKLSPDDKLIDTFYLLSSGDDTVGGGAHILRHFLAPSLRLHLLNCLLLKFALKKDLYLIGKCFLVCPTFFTGHSTHSGFLVTKLGIMFTAPESEVRGASFCVKHATELKMWKINCEHKTIHN